jgi:hypothetical protein
MITYPTASRYERDDESVNRAETVKLETPEHLARCTIGCCPSQPLRIYCTSDSTPFWES